MIEPVHPFQCGHFSFLRHSSTLSNVGASGKPRVAYFQDTGGIVHRHPVGDTDDDIGRLGCGGGDTRR